MLTGCIFLGHVELAVLCGCCAPRPDLIDYVNDVIAQAVEDRRNCRVSVLCPCSMKYTDPLLYIAQSCWNSCAVWLECRSPSCTHFWSC